MKINKIFYALLSTSLLATANTATAGDFKPLVRAGLDAGGDDLVTVVYSGGDTADIKAGQLFTFSGGIMYHPAQANYTVEATIGYKFDTANATNGTAEFTRMPIDVIASYRNKNHRIGGGFTYHMGPELSCDISGACSGNVEFSDAQGFIIQYAYEFETLTGSILDIGARYTSVDYEIEGVSGEVDGSAPGIFVSFAF